MRLHLRFATVLTALLMAASPAVARQTPQGGQPPAAPPATVPEATVPAATTPAVSPMRADLVLANWTLFARGILMTLELTAIALALGFCIAVPAGLARARRRPRISALVNAYVYLFRGTPLLVQTFLIYYGLAQFDWVRASWAWTFLREPWWCAVIAFSLNSGAYMTEIVRGAVETTPKGELEGARSLGLSPRQVDLLVLLPSALRRALPQFGNEAVFMLHGSAIASVITLQDILGDLHR